jgi:glycosyltransferase involved in cell wall biosynthesis
MPARPDSLPYVVLCADFDSYPDDALFAVDAVGMLPDPNVEVVLVGNASPATERRIRDAAKQWPARASLTLFTNYISRDELRALYAGAAALLSPLHDDARSRARFPSKLGDYLLSGRPIVSSAVGEVAAYLDNERTAYLAECTVASFADRLARALSQPESDAVGAAGRALALREFDYRMQGQRLATFLASVARGAR